MSEEQYEESERIHLEFEETLKAVFADGNPSSETAQKTAKLHKQWICYFCDGYCKEYRAGLPEIYVADERFKAHYERLNEGITEFLRDTIIIYCGGKI